MTIATLSEAPTKGGAVNRPSQPLLRGPNRFERLYPFRCLALPHRGWPPRIVAGWRPLQGRGLGRPSPATEAHEGHGHVARPPHPLPRCNLLAATLLPHTAAPPWMGLRRQHWGEASWAPARRVPHARAAPPPPSVPLPAPTAPFPRARQAPLGRQRSGDA